MWCCNCGWWNCRKRWRRRKKELNETIYFQSMLNSIWIKLTIHILVAIMCHLTYCCTMLKYNLAWELKERDDRRSITLELNGSRNLLIENWTITAENTWWILVSALVFVTVTVTVAIPSNRQTASNLHTNVWHLHFTSFSFAFKWNFLLLPLLLIIFFLFTPYILIFIQLFNLFFNPIARALHQFHINSNNAYFSNAIHLHTYTHTQ